MKATPHNTLSVTPEFANSDMMELMFGIKRSLAYQLAEKRLVRSVSIVGVGKERGKRLWDVASVRAYLNQLIEEDAKRRQAE